MVTTFQYYSPMNRSYHFQLEKLFLFSVLLFLLLSFILRSYYFSIPTYSYFYLTPDRGVASPPSSLAYRNVRVPYFSFFQPFCFIPNVQHPLSKIQDNILRLRLLRSTMILYVLSNSLTDSSFFTFYVLHGITHKFNWCHRHTYFICNQSYDLSWNLPKFIKANTTFINTTFYVHRLPPPQWLFTATSNR